MARLHTSFVLGFHGCDRAVGEDVISGRRTLLQSDKDYDWLGPGVYFWEADPLRAWEWADWKVERGEYSDPFVIGAAIDLGHCLDLIARDSLELVEASFEEFRQLVEGSTPPRRMPQNQSVSTSDKDRLLRFLDCAVIKFLHQTWEHQGLLPYDTVRGMFTEGGPLFPGSGFQKKTHVQIAVRNDDCIKGVFRAARPE